MTGSLNVGPRVMITRAGTGPHRPHQRGQPRRRALPFRTARAGRSRCGRGARHPQAGFPRGHHRRLPRDPSDHHARARPRHHVPQPDRARSRWSIGAMGVASAMHGHLQQKLDSIAVMKCIGARSGAGDPHLRGADPDARPGRRPDRRRSSESAVAAAFPGLIAKYFQMDVAAYWDPWPALQGVAVACLITLLFTVPPLLGIRDIRPAVIFRRERGRPPRDRGPAWLARIAILLGTGVVAATMTEGNWRMALRTAAFFTGGAGHRARAALARRMARAARLPRVAAPRRRRDLPGTLAPRHGEPLPARQSGAGGGGRAWRRGDVHPHRLPGAGRAGGPDPRQRATRHAQRLPAGYSGQPAHGAERTDPGSSPA